MRADGAARFFTWENDMEKTADADKVCEEPKRAMSIGPGRMKAAEYERRDWVVNAPQGTIPEDIQDPAFWALHAAKLSPYDHVEVRADDGTWIAQCIVLGCERTWARVHTLAVHRLTSADVAMTQAAREAARFELKFRGPADKWCVIRRKDGAIVKDGCHTKDQAHAWMKEHEKL
jgi:hypothetical protein